MKASCPKCGKNAKSDDGVHFQCPYCQAKFEYKKIRLDDIKQPTEPQSVLTAGQLERVKRMWSGIGRYNSESEEDWIYGFTLDRLPEREIRIYEILNVAWGHVCKELDMTEERKKHVCSFLVAMTVSSDMLSALSPEVAKVLVESYEKAKLEMA